MLKHVSFVTADADAVIRFYTGLGGAVSKDLITAEGFRRLVVSFEGGGRLQFFQLPDPVEEVDPLGAADRPAWEIQTVFQDSPDAPAAASQLLYPARPTPERSPHAWMEHIALYLPDLQGSVDALKQEGVTFARDLTLSPSGNPMAFVLDPDGRQVELLQEEQGE